MNTTRALLNLALPSIVVALAVTGCVAEPEAAVAQNEGAISGGERCMLPGGTDVPRAPLPRCAVVAPAGAKVRRQASTTSAEVQPSGWGGLPCGWDLQLASTSLGTTVASCNLWGEVDARAAAANVHGFIHASLIDCKMLDEGDDVFDARVRRACGESLDVEQRPPTYVPSTCNADEGWQSITTHSAVALSGGAGRDAAAVSTAAGKNARVAAIFRAYDGGMYIGCFKTSVSARFGGASSSTATFAVATTSPFFATAGGTTRHASQASVEYFLVDGDADVR
jgi:hypothetical protein